MPIIGFVLKRGDLPSKTCCTQTMEKMKAIQRYRETEVDSAKKRGNHR